MHEKNVDMMFAPYRRDQRDCPTQNALSQLLNLSKSIAAIGNAKHCVNPMTRLVDAVRPDSEAGRRFASMVDAMLSDAPSFQRNQAGIKAMLNEWREVRPALDAMIDKSPILREAEQLPRDLSEMGLLPDSKLWLILRQM
jgi:hypothetical protein